MRTALLQLLEDFLSAFVFLGIYLTIGNLTLAVGAADPLHVTRRCPAPKGPVNWR